VFTQQVTFRQLLPRGIMICEQSKPFYGSLLPEEATFLHDRCSEDRIREFTAGRTCARSCIAALGFERFPILRGPSREPVWPLGTIGSITHSADFCASVATQVTFMRSIGIDAEPHDALPTEIRGMILTVVERTWLESMPISNIQWSRLIFSIKESVFKAWFPITQTWLDFLDVSTTIDTSTQTFCATINHDLAIVHGLQEIHGAFAIGRDLLLSAAWVARANHSLGISLK
jgi:4'-phosphopantetheinyl transferase EntD